MCSKIRFSVKSYLSTLTAQDLQISSDLRQLTLTHPDCESKQKIWAKVRKKQWISALMSYIFTLNEDRIGRKFSKYGTSHTCTTMLNKHSLGLRNRETAQEREMDGKWQEGAGLTSKQIHALGLESHHSHQRCVTARRSKCILTASSSMIRHWDVPDFLITF